MLVQSLGQEDALEEEMVTNQYSCLKISMDRRAWRATYSPRGLKESNMTEHTYVHSQKYTHTHTNDEHAIINEKYCSSQGLHIEDAKYKDIII